MRQDYFNQIIFLNFIGSIFIMIRYLTKQAKRKKKHYINYIIMIYKYIQNSINPISLRQGVKNLSFYRANQIAKLPSHYHPASTI